MMDWVETRTELTPCLKCGAKLDMAISTRGYRPEPPRLDELGRERVCVTICIKCGHIMAYDDKLELRNLTETEMKELELDSHFQQTRSAWRAMEEERKGRETLTLSNKPGGKSDTSRGIRYRDYHHQWHHPRSARPKDQ